MRIRTVNTIVDAHNARKSACRLIVPVPDGSGRAGTITAALGRGRRQLTPALLGAG